MYRDSDEGYGGKSKGKLAAIGGILVALAAAGVGKVIGHEGVKAGIDAYDRHEAITKIDDFEKEGPMAAFLQELHKVDPERFEAFKAEMKDTIRTASTQAEANAHMLAYGRDTMAVYRKSAPNASDAKVRELAAAKLEMLKHVRSQSEDDCGRLAASGAFPEMKTGPGWREVVGRSAVILVRAGTEGMRHPVNRPDPSDEEYGEIGDRMTAAGVSAQELDALSRGAFNTLPASQQCSVMVTMFEQALDLNSPTMLAALLKE